MSMDNSTWYLVKHGSENYFAIIAFAAYNPQTGGDCAFISHGNDLGAYVPSEGRFIIRMGGLAIWTGAVQGTSGTGFGMIPYNGTNPPIALPYSLTSIKPVKGELAKDSEEYHAVKNMLAK